MKNFFILILISFLLLTACQRNEVLKTHGVAYLDKREKLIIVNESNKNDIIEILGQPSTKGLTDNSLWIYIERTQTRGGLLKLGKNYIKKNNVLVLEFNKFGILSKKEFYDKDNMKDVEFAKTITDNDIRKENFIYSFLNSVKQKMETRRKSN